jgi:peptide/nickel transport system substrate-binding protein
MDQQGSAFAMTRRGLAAATLAAAGLPAIAQAQSARRYVTARNGNFDNMDPHQLADIGRIAIRLNMYDALVRWTGNPPELKLWLAEKVEIGADNRTYTFTLRPGVKFHDGSALTADDVVYSMERILAIRKGSASLFATVIQPGSTKALNPLTVQFNLTEPYAIFMGILSELWVVNARVVRANEANGDWAQAWLTRNEAGSGGYRLGRNDPAVGFQMTRFREHFMPWHEGAVDLAEYRAVIETSSRVLGLQRGDFDTTDGYLPFEQITRLRQNPRLNVIEAETLRTFYMGINHAKAPMGDLHLRKALAHAFDYDGFINNMLEGSVVRNAGIIPGNMWGAPADLPAYPYDLDRAKWHLAQVQAPLRQIVIGVLAGYPHSEQAGQLMQAGCSRIGLNTRVVTDPSPIIFSRRSDPNRLYDLVLLWQSCNFADPYNWAGLYDSRVIGERNWSFYRNARVDELLVRAMGLVDQAQQRPLYEEVSRILVEEVAGIFVYNTKFYGAYSRRARSVAFCPVSDTQDLRGIAMA